MKLSKRISKYWKRYLAYLAFALLFGWALYRKNIYILYVLAFAVLIRMIFLSREGSERLKEMRAESVVEVRNDRAYSLNRNELIASTLKMMSPFYAFAILEGLLLPIGKSSAFLYLSVPTVILCCVAFKLAADCWRELGASRLFFWLLQILCYTLSLLPGILIWILAG